MGISEYKVSPFVFFLFLFCFVLFLFVFLQYEGP